MCKPLLLRVVTVAVLLVNGAAQSSGAACPTFKDYLVRGAKQTAAVAPIIAPAHDVEEKGYRQVVDDYVHREPANFAGHYRVSTDTCGTWRVFIMVHNLKTGQVWREGCLSWPYNGLRPDLSIRLRHSIDSGLLLAYGCVSSARPCGGNYYTMALDGLHLICTEPFPGGIFDRNQGVETSLSFPKHPLK